MKSATFFATLVCATTLLLAVADDNPPEIVLAETHADIAAMKKKGATTADCKDLAKTTCKEVLMEITTSQQAINSQSGGSHCVTLNQKTIDSVVRQHHKQVTTWRHWKKQITVRENAIVRFSSRKFNSLKPGKCGFVFSSRSYLSAKAKYDRAVKKVSFHKGKVTESKRVVEKTKRTVKLQREHCYCNTVKRRDTLWRQYTHSKVRSRQQKALAKCKMMQCVLNGTPLTSSKCKAVLPKLHNKKLHKFAEWAHKTGKCGAFAKAAAAKRKRMEAQEKARIKARERQQKAAEKKSKAARKAAEKKRKAEWKYSTVGTGYCNKFVWVTPAARFPKCQRGLGAVNRYCGPYNVQSTDPDHRKQKNSFTVKGCFKLCASYYGHKVGRWGNNMKGIRLVNQGLGVNLNNKIGHQFFLGRFGNSNGNACGCCGQGSNGRSARFWGACTTYKMVSYPGFRRL